MGKPLSDIGLQQLEDRINNLKGKANVQETVLKNINFVMEHLEAILASGGLDSKPATKKSFQIVFDFYSDTYGEADDILAKIYQVIGELEEDLPDPNAEHKLGHKELLQ